MAHNLKPFRDYSEHDVVNLFSFSGDSSLVVKGLVVKVMAPGFNPGITNVSPTEFAGNVGGDFGTNIVSQRYGVSAKVAIAASGDSALGLTLMDVRETDENGEKLLFNPRKAAEMGVVVSGQAVPVLTKGLVMYSGTAATAGHFAFVGATNGELASAAVLNAGAVKIGKWLSTSVQNVALLKIEL